MPFPSSAWFDLRLPFDHSQPGSATNVPLREAVFTRYMMLTDQPSFGLSALREVDYDTYEEQVVGTNRLYAAAGIKPVTNGFNSQGDYRIDFLGTYRGKVGRQTILFGKQTLIDCLDQGVDTSNLSPPLSQTIGSVNPQ